MSAAFTRLELVATLAALVLLAAVVLPAFAGAKSHTDRVVCLNNLRQLGMAIHRWAGDHGDRPPWRTPWCEGGTQTSGICSGGSPSWYGLQNNLWFHLAMLTNDLPSPRSLVCPADAVRVADDWSASPDGGFLHPNYRNNACSYPVGLDANMPTLRPDYFSDPMVLATDRNLRTNGVGACSTGVMNAAAIYTEHAGQTWWLEALHGLNGNILRTDGQVLSVNSSQLRAAMVTHDDNGSVHFLFPR